MTTQSEQIAALNDRFRRQLMMPLHFEKFIIPGKVIITSGVTSMTGVEKMEIFCKVREFDSFFRRMIHTANTILAHLNTTGEKSSGR